VVEVTRFRTLVSDTGRENVPFDMSMADLSALAKDDAGFYVIYPDALMPGDALWHGFPVGPYFMTLNGYNIYTDESALDLGVVNLGRSSATLSDGGVTLSLDVTGLASWVPFSDVLQLTSANAGYVAVNAQSYVAAPPDAGATEATLALNHFAACSTQIAGFAPLIDADAGDVAMLTQLRAQVLDGGLVELRTLVRAATLPPFTEADHLTTQVSAALAPAAQSDHFAVDFRQSAFAALLPQVHASAVAASSTLTLTMLPYGPDDGAYTAAPDLAVVRPVDPSVDVALAFDTGDPFPTGWAKMGTARYSTQVDVPFPDGGSRQVSADILVADLLPDLLSGPIAPRVSPPRNVTVNGGPADVRTQIPRTPILSWSKPDIGEPTSYGINLLHLSRVGVGPVILLTEDQFFETADTQFEMPFGELAPGEEYVFAITAFEAPASMVTKAPFKGKLPYSSATMLTALFRVDPTLLHP
jgi:hypothetical protein